MRMEETDRGFVYFLRAGAGGPIKIGFSNDPKFRVNDIQTSHYEKLILLGYVPAGMQEERRLHRMLKKSRIRGEWYRPTREVLRVVMLHVGEMRELAREYVSGGIRIIEQYSLASTCAYSAWRAVPCLCTSA